MERLGLEHAGEEVQGRASNYEEAFTLAAVADEPISQLERIAIEAVHLAGARQIVVADLRTEHTLAEVGHMLRLTRGRIQQIEERVLDALRDQFMPEPALMTLVQRLRNGVAADEGVLAALGGGERWDATNFCAVLMRSLGLERPKGFEGRINGYWTAAPDCVVRSLAAAATDLPLAEGELLDRLGGLQLPADFPFEAVVAQRGSPLRLHPVLNAWVRPNASQRDAAWLLLRKHGEPVTADTLAEILRMKKQALAESLRRDDRFEQRRPSGWWALAEWEGHVGYASTLDAARSVVRDLGPLAYKAFEEEVIRRYPVSRAAVQQTLLSIEIGQWPDGRIDVRVNGAPAIPEPVPDLARGITVDAESESIQVEVDVTHDILRGSGVPISNYVTWWLDLREAPMSLTFTSHLGPVILRRNLGGAALSSLRDAAEALGATAGCRLLVTLRRLDKGATIDLGCVDHTH
jgi:hypothetical protein